jgi:LysM repeat protein
MEGGYLPWKNKSINVVDQLEAIRKPLPPPPAGSTWYRSDDGQWYLRSCKGDTPCIQTVVPECPVPVGTVVTHTVMPDDTLQGLCLRYGCSPLEVRRINNFSGNSIQFKKTLIIPVNRHSCDVEHSVEYSREITVQQFRNATGESLAEARVYLEDADYDLEAALSAWRSDEQWEHGKSGALSRTAASTAVGSSDSLAPSPPDTPGPRNPVTVMVGTKPMRIVAPTCVVEMSFAVHS